jgi:hypothetical protein
MDFEQAKKVLQLTDARIRKFGSVDASTSREINEAIFKFQPFQRLVIAHHAQEALTHLQRTDGPAGEFPGAANSYGNQSQSRRVSRICPS